MAHNLLLIRFWSSRQAVANPAGLKSPVPHTLEVSVVIFEVILLVGFSIPLFAERIDRMPDPEDENVVECHVIAQQFVWNIHYPGPDRKFGKRESALIDSESNPIGLDAAAEFAKDDIWILNELVLPVGSPTLIHLSSFDVVHCFALPEMRIKQDVVPGMANRVWFQPVKESGDRVWQIACAQLCGVGHYRMAGRLRIVSQSEFDAWYTERLNELAQNNDDW
ncbi:MAG: hypothetical protein O3C57_00565 [Verrucomicrobia bacterium]|nr:hypothetical protein [Verrucomicrobiota bacterium]